MFGSSSRSHLSAMCSGAASPRRARGSRPRIALVGFLLLATSAGAQVQWTGAVSANWFNAGNWNPGVPGAADEVVIDTVVPAPTVASILTGEANGITVGDLGTGSLAIEAAGGIDNGGPATVGREPSGQGSVLVTFPGSLWDNAGELWVGYEGTGVVTVTNGGQLNGVAPAGLGYETDSQGDVVVSGAGSSWTAAPPGGTLVVGRSGGGGITIEDGASLASISGRLGSLSSGNGSVLVTGPGSGWSMTGSLLVGDIGTGELEVLAGGQVITGFSGRVGSGSGSVGYATISGPGSSWTASDVIIVGGFGTGTMEVLDSGQVSSSDAFLGQVGGTGTVLVSGPGSTWTALGSFDVGAQGSGDLSVLAGGQVLSDAGSIGAAPLGFGTARVEGVGSSWVLVNVLEVGGEGSGQLDIALGGLVDVDGDVWVAREPGSSGELSIDVDSRLEVGNDFHHGAGGTYRVEIEPAGTSGVVAAGGEANLLGGALDVDVLFGAYVPGTVFTIVEATGGVNGTFGAFTYDDVGLDLEIVYEEDAVLLVVGEPQPSVVEVPTLSDIGLVLLCLAIGIFGMAAVRGMG